MSGWDGWAANILAAGQENGGGAALYCPSSGSIWGRHGAFDCAGGLQFYDQKANGMEATVPTINGKKFMFIRNTLDDDPISIFKSGSDSLFITRGPSGSKVAVYVKEAKPESADTKITTYLKPHV